MRNTVLLSKKQKGKLPLLMLQTRSSDSKLYLAMPSGGLGFLSMHEGSLIRRFGVH